MDKIVKSLLTLSEEELASARNEYKKGIYHKSLFLFQQSVEKAYKALALDTRQIELADLRNVGHDYIKLLKKSLTNLPQSTRKKVIEENIKMFEEDEVTDSDEVFSHIMRTGRADFFNLTKDDIQELEKYIIKHKRLVAKSDFSNLKDIVADSNKLNVQEMAEFLAEQENGFTPEQLRTMALFQGHGVTIQILGLMTSPHSEQTRYPLEQNNYKCPTEIYTIDFPLIKHQKKLMKMAGESIAFLKLHCPNSI